MSTSTVLTNAKDLTRQAPRSASVRLGGYVIMARTIDKCRALINGTIGEYHFDCPLDNKLFSFKGVAGRDVKTFIASGASDEEILAWFGQNGLQKTEQEVQAWSAQTTAHSPFNVPDKREWFSGECQRVGLDPAKSTLFQFLDADDKLTFSNV